MLRLSKLTDYAVVLLIRLHEAEGACGVATCPSVSAATGVPEPTVAKIFKVLASGGLVTSQRGARGGYRLARPLAAISIADVIVAVDGPIALAACVDGGQGGCDVLHLCAMKGRWRMVNDAIQDALAGITLADMRDHALPAGLRTAAPAFQTAS